MTNDLVKFFQTSPSAATGNVIDLVTWNNNVGQWGKLGYFNEIVNSANQRLSLTFSNSILNATLTTITWTSAVIPNTAMWTSGTDILIVESGRYIFNFEMAVPTSITGRRLVRLVLNGVNAITNQYMDAAINVNNQSSFVIELYEGDIITYIIQQDTTATRTVTGSLYIQKMPEIKD
jgi:hypothetical protein